MNSTHLPQKTPPQKLNLSFSPTAGERANSSVSAPWRLGYAARGANPSLGFLALPASGQSDHYQRHQQSPPAPAAAAQLQRCEQQQHLVDERDLVQRRAQHVQLSTARHECRRPDERAPRGAPMAQLFPPTWHPAAYVSELQRTADVEGSG